MFPIQYVQAKFYNRWQMINKDPLMICPEWRRSPVNQRPRIKVDPTCIAFCNWINERLDKHRVQHIEGQFQLIRFDETKPYSPDNCEIVPRRLAISVSYLRDQHNKVTAAQVEQLFKERMGTTR